MRKGELPEGREVSENDTEQADVHLERTRRLLLNKLLVAIVCQLDGHRVAQFSAAEKEEQTRPLLLRGGHRPGSVVYSEVARRTERAIRRSAEGLQRLRGVHGV